MPSQCSCSHDVECILYDILYDSPTTRVAVVVGMPRFIEMDTCEREVTREFMSDMNYRLLGQQKNKKHHTISLGTIFQKRCIHVCSNKGNLKQNRS